MIDQGLTWKSSGGLRGEELGGLRNRALPFFNTQVVGAAFQQITEQPWKARVEIPQAVPASTSYPKSGLLWPLPKIKYGGSTRDVIHLILHGDTSSSKFFLEKLPHHQQGWPGIKCVARRE